MVKLNTISVLFSPQNGEIQQTYIKLKIKGKNMSILDTLGISEEQYENIKISIRNLYNLQEFDVSSISNIYFTDYDNQLRPIVIIILAIKWLFIEQDVTYWNWSGRAMLMNGLEKNALV